MPIQPTLLKDIAGFYGTSLSQLKPVAGGHFSHVYEYTEDPQSYILRITPPNTDVDLHSMRAVLEWMAFLSTHDGPVTRPVRSRQSNLIEQVKHEGQTYIAVAFEKTPGVLAEGMPPADWSNELFQALGHTLGLSHRLAQAYVPADEAFKRPQWDRGGNCFNPQEDLVDVEPVVVEKRARVLAQLQSLPKNRESFGLVHLDLHFGNFFVDVEQQKITLLDFDDCAYGWYVMDIAMLLFDVLVVYSGPDQQQFCDRFLENVLKGYHSQKPISQFWVAQLPDFLKLVEIGVYVMLYRYYNPKTADEWVSKFMLERQYRIEQEIPYIDLNFEALYTRATL